MGNIEVSSQLGDIVLLIHSNAKVRFLVDFEAKKKIGRAFVRRGEATIEFIEEPVQVFLGIGSDQNIIYPNDDRHKITTIMSSGVKARVSSGLSKIEIDHEIPECCEPYKGCLFKTVEGFMETAN